MFDINNIDKFMQTHRSHNIYVVDLELSGLRRLRAQYPVHNILSIAHQNIDFEHIKYLCDDFVIIYPRGISVPPEFQDRDDVAKCSRIRRN